MVAIWGGYTKKGGGGGFQKRFWGGGVLNPLKSPKTLKKNGDLTKKFFIIRLLRAAPKAPPWGGFDCEVSWGLTLAMRKVKIAFEEA
jgi:hypothetical protein